MSIDGINTAMTTTQFARARSAARAVETTDASIQRWGLPAHTGNAPERDASRNPAHRPNAPLLPPSRLHFTYKPLPGNPAAAQRTPQVPNPAFWSTSLNHVG
jgi:hypothetical protein